MGWLQVEDKLYLTNGELVSILGRRTDGLYLARRLSDEELIMIDDYLNVVEIMRDNILPGPHNLDDVSEESLDEEILEFLSSDSSYHIGGSHD